MGSLGVPETIFIFVLALLIFGPKKLPELGRTIGKAMTEFRRASSELKATFDREMHAIERETELKDVAQSVNNPSETYDYNYDSYYDSGGYGSESYETTANDSTAGASATQGADQTAEETQPAETASAEIPHAGEEPGPTPATEDDQRVKS